MKRRALVLFGLLVGCGGKAPSSAPVGAVGVGSADASSPDGSHGAAALLLVDPCPGGPSPPDTLECTGLYTDIVKKQLAAPVRPYTPAVPLWSDGAVKNRWVYLPPGKTIDTSLPSEWVFPIGTKFWKEFSVGGKRIETRLFEKVQRNFWRYATYAWNADESATLRSVGGDIVLGGGATYHIPTQSECDDCHKGRSDRILGFEQALLGLPGAQGITLDQLVNEGRLSAPLAQTNLQVGDDGTGLASPALAWLHVNCGVSCHNTNTNSFAFPAGMNLRLDPMLLDGTSLASSDSLVTTVGVSAKTASWNGAIRIVPGDPAESLLVRLISHRGTGMQMPPIASRIVDDADVANIVAWVSAMHVPPGLVADAGVEAGSDADLTEAGALDMPTLDASPDDAVNVSDGTLLGGDATVDDVVTIDAAPAPPVADAGVDVPDANGTVDGDLGDAASDGGATQGDDASDASDSPNTLE